MFGVQLTIGIYGIMLTRIMLPNNYSLIAQILTKEV